MLADEQKRRFARNGFLVLRDAVDDDLIDEGRRAIEADDSMGPGNQNEPRTEPFRSINEELYEYALDLVGEGKLAPPGDATFGTDDGEEMRIGLHFPEDLPALREPHSQRRRRDDLGIHVDNQTNEDGGLYGLGAAIYFNDIGPRDAGFTVWPGSHWMTAEHCELYMQSDRDPPVKNVRVRNESEFDDLSELFELFEPFEIAGDAGTVTLWHGSLIHSAGMHLAPGSLRMAGFTRFYFEPGAVDHDEAFANPFAYWDGVTEAEEPG